MVRTSFARLGQEIEELAAMPERAPGMRMVPTGVTIAEAWEQAADDAARREILNRYNVRVVLHPRRKGEKASRCEITGMTPHDWLPVVA